MRSMEGLETLGTGNLIEEYEENRKLISVAWLTGSVGQQKMNQWLSV